MLTNIVLVIPTLALLLIIAAYLKVRGVMVEALFIGLHLLALGGPRDPGADLLAAQRATSSIWPRLSGMKRRQDHLHRDRPEHEPPTCS